MSNKVYIKATNAVAIVKSTAKILSFVLYRSQYPTLS